MVAAASSRTLKIVFVLQYLRRHGYPIDSKGGRKWGVQSAIANQFGVKRQWVNQIVKRLDSYPELRKAP